MSKVARSFTVDKDTKNTRRFQEVETNGTPAAIGTIYVPKETLQTMTGDGTLPEHLVVTIEIPEG